MRLGTLARIGVGLSVAFGLVALAGPQTHTEARGTAPDNRPNIILITTDDQTTYDLKWMPNTRTLIAGSGVRFTDGLSPHSLCCPARAAIITGQYGQNNGVRHNIGARGGYKALIDPDDTLAAWLQQAGYQTAQAGKFLNGYSLRSGEPEGWDHWNPFVDGTTFVKTLYYNDGNPIMRRGYVDDITNAYARTYIREFAGPRPFFVWISNVAPHRVKKSEYSYAAPRFRGTLGDAWFPVPAKPSFNEADVSDQPPATRRELVDRKEMRKRFISRIEALQAADEAVARLVAQLDTLGELDNTYIFFVSDNGYLLGEHRLVRKNWIFRESMAIPFLVRVPGAAAGTVSDLPVTLTDLAPTIAELAETTPGRLVDGVSFAPLLRGGQPTWRDTQLIQTGRKGETFDSWQIRGVRTDRYTYGRDVISGFEQLYDRRRDPYEVSNVARKPRYRPVLNEMRARLKALRDCAGAACSQSFGPAPDPR